MFRKFKKPVLVLSALAVCASFAACGSTEAKVEAKTETEAPATEAPETKAPETEKEEEKEEEKVVAEAPGVSGFAEIPIGEGQVVGPYQVEAVYFQAVDMFPAGQNPSKEESDLHLEADIHLLPEAAQAYGFGLGEDIWPAYLTVKYEVLDKENNVVTDGSFMPMNADDGPHYGCNMKKGLLTVGQYKLKFVIMPPANYLMHTDEETGVPAKEGVKEFFEPQEVEFDWNYTGEQLQNE